MFLFFRGGGTHFCQWRCKQDAGLTQHLCSPCLRYGTTAVMNKDAVWRSYREYQQKINHLKLKHFFQRRCLPREARPWMPHPAPPTPRARRCGQHLPIVCRHRLLKRAGCWLKETKKQSEVIRLITQCTDMVTSGIDKAVSEVHHVSLYITMGAVAPPVGRWCLYIPLQGPRSPPGRLGPWHSCSTASIRTVCVYFTYMWHCTSTAYDNVQSYGCSESKVTGSKHECR